MRQEREQRKIGLREMARQIGVSPTYLSMIERGEFPAPAEDKVTAIAKIIGRDRDELLALAGRVSTDLNDDHYPSPLDGHLVRSVSQMLEFHDIQMEVDDVFRRLVELMGKSHPEELKEWLKSPELAASAEKLSRLCAAVKWPSKLGNPLKTKKPARTKKPVRKSLRSRKLRAKPNQPRSEHGSAEPVSGLCLCCAVSNKHLTGAGRSGKWRLQCAISTKRLTSVSCKSSYRIAAGTEKLIDSTMRLWQQRMRRDISRQDARQIIEQVTGFFDVLKEWERDSRAANDNRATSSITPKPPGTDPMMIRTSECPMPPREARVGLTG